MKRSFSVYFLTNSLRTMLYTGVTSDLPRRVSEHKTKAADGFTARYNVTALVPGTLDPTPDCFARCAGKAGTVLEVEVLDSQGLANQAGSESCVGAGNRPREALIGEHAG